jgi:hypothetical protein
MKKFIMAGLIFLLMTQIMGETDWNPKNNTLAKDHNYAGIKYAKSIPGAMPGYASPDEKIRKSVFAKFKSWGAFCEAMEYFYGLSRYNLQASDTIGEAIFKLADGGYGTSPKMAFNLTEIFLKLQAHYTATNKLDFPTLESTLGTLTIDKVAAHKVLNQIDKDIYMIKKTQVIQATDDAGFLARLNASEFQMVPDYRVKAPENRKFRVQNSRFFAHARSKKISYVDNDDELKELALSVVQSNTTNQRLMDSASFYLGVETTLVSQITNMAEGASLAHSVAALADDKLVNYVKSEMGIGEIRDIHNLYSSRATGFPFLQGMVSSDEEAVSKFYNRQILS